MVDVFISYKRTDRELVTLIAGELLNFDVSVWFDEALRSGLSFADEINAKLQEAKVVVVLWSAEALIRQNGIDSWVIAEATIARDRQRAGQCRYFPVVLGNLWLPAPFNVDQAHRMAATASRSEIRALLQALLSEIAAATNRPGLRTLLPAFQGTPLTQELWFKEFPDDPYTKKHQDRANEAEELKEWQSVSDRDPDALLRHVRRFPSGTTAIAAQDALARIYSPMHEDTGPIIAWLHRGVALAWCVWSALHGSMIVLFSLLIPGTGAVFLFSPSMAPRLDLGAFGGFLALYAAALLVLISGFRAIEETDDLFDPIYKNMKPGSWLRIGRKLPLFVGMATSGAIIAIQLLALLVLSAVTAFSSLTRAFG
jgi:hypothetical protein